MASERKTPKTLQEAVVYFSNPDRALDYVAVRRWPNGVTCPTCGSAKVTFLANQRKWQCSSHHRKRQFSAKTGSIFEDSAVGLDKWLVAMWLVCNCRNGISSYEVHRAIGVTQRTAWFMDHRIRMALHSGSFEKLSGEVEIDETFIGGKSRNMHLSKRRKKITAPGPYDKVTVMGMLERGGKVVTKVVANQRRHHLHEQVREHVEAGAAIFTDELRSYRGLEAEYVHQVINHAVEYARENVHTNGMENFWSLLKRGLHGTYVSVEPFHLFRYLDEQAYRFNTREMTDAERFSEAVTGIVGKRLTWDRLTGKEVDGATQAN